MWTATAATAALRSPVGPTPAREETCCPVLNDLSSPSIRRDGLPETLLTEGQVHELAGQDTEGEAETASKTGR